MGEPNIKKDIGAVFPPVRNRKRFLEASEEQSEEETLRRQNLLSEWQETLRSMGVPSKKGFIGNESQYNDMIDQGLADNFEDSLSGLGVDITTASYNMSDAMMALPNVGLFKPEPPHVHVNPNESVSPITDTSPSTFDDSSQSNTTDRIFKLLATDSTYPSDLNPTPSIHQLLQQHIVFSENHINGEPSSELVKVATSPDVPSEESFTISSPTDEINESPTHGMDYENKFQYILGAATSVAVKLAEESLTYLNQGQSYEIKVKKLGDITGCQGRLYHTKIRFSFHERRMQYMEKEQIALWKSMRPGERICEVDVPLSYGISDVIQDSKYLNVCEFDWDPTKEVGVYVKVNCISTEFTPKKHGGEKGVPFKLLAETYSQSKSQTYTDGKLHACACQIKVFKLKGADRKHKQDRERIMKRSSNDISKFQPQCDCTILQDISTASISESENHVTVTSHHASRSSSANSKPSPSKEVFGGRLTPPLPLLTQCSSEKVEGTTNETDYKTPTKQLTTEANASETEIWLISNRFSNLISIFANFSGFDLLQLSRSELIEICGLVDGIRLFNCLHPKAVMPLLTLYVRLEPQMPYNALYLHTYTLTEFVGKVAELLSLTSECVHDVYFQGPSNINILATDEVIKNLKNEDVFSLDILQETSGEKFRLLLRKSDAT